MIRSMPGSKSEIDQLEHWLGEKGYRPTNKTDENELAQLEYFRDHHSGSENRFEGPTTYRLVWRDSEGE